MNKAESYGGWVFLGSMLAVIALYVINPWGVIHGKRRKQ